MAVVKRLNINKFTSEADNDAFIEELKQMWLAWENPLIDFLIPRSARSKA